MKELKKSLISIVIRYFFLILASIQGLWIFYFIFTPLTIYPVYFLLNLFFDASLSAGTIIIGKFHIEIIEACVAGSAYYLLLILNLSVPNIKIKKRILMIGLSFVILLIVNILRIFFLSVLAISDFSLFDITHKVFWYTVSILLVIGIWFYEVKFFKIRQIPFYSDLKLLYKESSFKK